MRTLLLLTAALTLGIPSAGVAGPIGLCQSGTLQDYIDLGANGCTIGGATFLGFVSALLPDPTIADQIDATDIRVNPLDLPSAVGVEFALTASDAAGGKFLETLIGYSVIGTLMGGSTSLAGSSVTPDGSLTVVQDMCLDGAFSPLGPFGCSGIQASQILFDIGIDQDLAESIAFAALGLSVFTDITIDAGLGGTAMLDGTVTNQFTVAPIPEPSTLLLLGTGVAALIARRRRRPLS